MYTHTVHSVFSPTTLPKAHELDVSATFNKYGTIYIYTYYVCSTWQCVSYAAQLELGNHKQTIKGVGESKQILSQVDPTGFGWAWLPRCSCHIPSSQRNKKTTNSHVRPTQEGSSCFSDAICYTSLTSSWSFSHSPWFPRQPVVLPGCGSTLKDQEGWTHRFHQWRAGRSLQTPPSPGQCTLESVTPLKGWRGRHRLLPLYWHYTAVCIVDKEI